MWIALFISYNGDGYNGMQYQYDEHVNTVEN
jgi:tRNA U38,U39,U40 pseudouridine synthase TruA